jgi:hypothetical protein
MPSKFRIRIENVETGEAALLHPGAQGERDLVAAIVAKGVGVFRTQAKVEAAIREVLLELKSEVQAS